MLTSTDTAEILGRIEPVLMADPVVHTIFGTVQAYLRRAGEGGWCAYDGPALAVRSSPRHPVALTDGWADLHALARAIAALDPTGLGGPPPVVNELVELLGRAPAHRTDEQLYRLGELEEPSGVPGRARVANEDDLEIVVAWVLAFSHEVLGALPAGFDAQETATSAITLGRVWLWLDPAGRPVSIAARRAPVAGVARIGPVYTPPEQRGHGYGTAATARAAADVLADDAIAVLYADRANRTSNQIYRAIGFRPVSERLSITF